MYNCLERGTSSWKLIKAVFYTLFLSVNYFLASRIELSKPGHSLLRPP